MASKEIVIVAFKHNKRVHRTWYQTYLIEDNEDYVVVGSTHSFVVESDGRRWRAIEPAISIFMKKEWFNVVCMMKPSGVWYYVNIASPSIIEDDVIKYVDYDLDFKVDDTYFTRTLDEYEYKRNKRKYGYSDKLDEVIKYNFIKVKKLINEKKFPFNHEMVNDYYKKYLLMED